MLGRRSAPFSRPLVGRVLRASPSRSVFREAPFRIFRSPLVVGRTSAVLLATRKPNTCLRARVHGTRACLRDRGPPFAGSAQPSSGNRARQAEADSPHHIRKNAAAQTSARRDRSALLCKSKPQAVR